MIRSNSDDGAALTASPLLIIFSVCVSEGCTDSELHSLAAKLKDWFGVLHLDANRDLKSSDSFDTTTGREYTRPACAPARTRVRCLVRAGSDVDCDPALFSVMSTCLNTTQPCHYTRRQTHTQIAVCCSKHKKNL